MELREGYKKTEVGIIPNEWTPKTYGELFQFLNTSSFSRDELSEEGDVRCVHYGDIHTKYHQFLDFSNGFNSFIDLERGKKYPFVKDGDIIMADASEDYSGIGKSVEVKNLGDKLAISGLHTFLLRDKNGDFEDGFKAYIHSMAPVKKSMDRLATGLKVYGVSKANLKTVLVPVPPPKEQKAIATALSDVDTLITNLDKLIAKKKAIKQGVMQRLLKSPAQGGQRLPGFEGEWIDKTLDKVSSSLVRGPFGGALKKEFFVHSGYKVYEQRNAIYATVDLGNYFINEDKFKELQRFEVKPGDFIVSCSGTIGRIYQIPENYQKGVINQALLKITINSSEIDEKYFFYQFTWDHFQNKVIDDTQGGAMKNLVGMDKFKKAEIPCPPSLDEQKAIATILSDMDKAIEAIESKKSKYLRIKQGMMQELLTGKTRLI
jgi:type I restriction enzyme S subunit